MDREFDRAIKVLKKNYHRLIQRKGVTGVDVNYRHRNGKMTDEIVIRVHVEEKVPLDQLRSNQVIKSIDGVPVDILEQKNDYLSTAEAATAGMSIAPQIDGVFGGAGTFGVACRDAESGDVRGLTNAHVVYAGHTKTSLPSKIPMFEAKKKKQIGNAIREKSFLNSEVDCALIAPLDEVTFEPGVANLMDPPGKVGELKRKHIRKKVRLHKLGAKTGETTGVLSSITQSFNANGNNFMFQIAIRAIDGAFSDHGDSGSVVIFDDAVVGLLHGLSDDGQIAIASHMKDVVDQLGIKF